MELKKLPACFYRTVNGTEPVREWLRSLDVDDRFLIGSDIATAEFGWPVGMPLMRPLGRNLFEIRTNLTSGRIARVIFCIAGRHMVLLHGFIKKTAKIPRQDLGLALSRMRETLS